MKDRNENRPGYKKTKVGWIPEEWGCEQLSKLCAIRSGGTPSKEVEEYWNGETPWITANDMKTFELKGSQIKITRKGVLNGTRLAPERTILILTRGMALFREVLNRKKSLKFSPPGTLPLRRPAG